jgi:Membrane proteins related to metalloendopeptidases
MNRYRFNKDQLRFVEVRGGLGRILRKGFSYFIMSLLLALLYYVVYSAFFYTPEERFLLQEQRLMNQEYERLYEKMGSLEAVLDELESRDRAIYQSVFKSLPTNIGGGDAVHIDAYQDLVASDDFALVQQTHRKYEELAQRAQQVEALLQSLKTLASSEKGRSIPSILPLTDLDIHRVGATVGQRIHPFYKTVREHTGLDLIAALGIDVLVTADGVVQEVRRSSREDGNSVTVHHDGGYVTVYSHLQSALVRKGQKVKQGAVIGRVGNSGLSFAPHLHYEVRKDDKVENPIHYFFGQLFPAEYTQMMVAAYNSGQSLD